MMYQQRSEPPEESLRLRDELWLSRAEKPPHPQQGDYYVALDERIEATIRLSVASWPKLDQAGRLKFERHFQPVFVEESELLAVINRHRRESGDLERPLRVGDAFFVRAAGSRGPGKNPEQWEQIFDVSSLARDESKIALYSAVAPTVEDDQMTSTGHETSPDDLPRPGPTASPVV
ncbi:MAG TPA: hypothetical protein VIC04_05170 [Terriglobia bacterium]